MNDGGPRRARPDRRTAHRTKTTVRDLFAPAGPEDDYQEWGRDHPILILLLSLLAMAAVRTWDIGDWIWSGARRVIRRVREIYWREFKCADQILRAGREEQLTDGSKGSLDDQNDRDDER
jgi:hypothetical protein